MKRCLFCLSLVLVLTACTQSSSQETPAIEEKSRDVAEWPEELNFCRPNPDDPAGPAECLAIHSAQEWLDFGPMIGDEIWIWPENMPPPPLLEGMAWSRERDPTNGESYWLIVEA